MRWLGDPFFRSLATPLGFGGAVSSISYLRSEIGDVGNDTVVVTFSSDINSPGTDYSAGVTIKINGSDATISSATRQTDKRVVHYVLSADGDANDVVTWEYDAGTGDLEDLASGQVMSSVSAKTSTNNIATHFWFNLASDSGHLVTLGV